MKYTEPKMEITMLEEQDVITDKSVVLPDDVWDTENP
jgi:hypothetical protein